MSSGNEISNVWQYLGTMLRRLRHGGLMLALLLPVTAWGQICAVSEENSRFQQALVQALQQHQRVVPIPLGRFSLERLASCELVLGIGHAAAARLGEYPGPVVYLLVSREQYASLQQGSGRYPRSAIFIDQPLERYSALLRIAFPDNQRVLFLSGQRTRGQVDELRQRLAVADKFLQEIPFNPQMKLDELLGEYRQPGNVLLVLPDSEVVNSDTARPMIMLAYHHLMPLVGYSENLVKAGALMALYASVEDVVHDTNRVLGHWRRNGMLPRADFGRQYSVAINYQLARAMQLRLPTEQVMERNLKRALNDE